MEEFTCNRRSYKVTYMQTEFLRKIGQTSSGEPILEGIEAKLLNKLAKKINFTYDLQEIEFPHYGKMLPNKSWTGVVGRLYSKQADFAIAGLGDNSLRRTVIDFSEPYMRDTYNFFVGVKEETRTGYYFLSPFKIHVWLLLVACAIMVFLLLYIFSHPQLTRVSKHNANLSASLINISWLVAITILRIHYGNELKASASITVKNNINTLEELASFLRLGSTKLFIDEHSSVGDKIENMPSKPYGGLFRRVRDIRPPRKTDLDDIYAGRVITVRPLLEMELSLLEAGYPPHKIRAVSEPLTDFNTVIGFQKNFTCQGAFNWVIKALYETGCQQKWLEILRSPVTKEELMVKDLEAAVNYIRLTDLQSTFKLLFISYLIYFLMAILLKTISSIANLITKLENQRLNAKS